MARAGAAVTLLTAAALVLSGCASWQIKQRAWADRVEALPGVESLKLIYANTWPNGGVKHDVTLVLAPGISEAEARKIAAVSCESDPTITSISVSTSGSVVGERRVDKYEIATRACIDADELARFSHAMAAMAALGPDFVGNFEQAGWSEIDPADMSRDWNFPAASYSVNVPVTEGAMLIDAIRELTARITDVPLSVRGTEVSDGDLWNDGGARVDVWLTPDADFERIAPALAAALALPYTGILATDDSITVRLAADANFSSPEAAAFLAAADAAGIAAGVSPILLKSGDPSGERELLDAVRAVPGGVAVSATRETDLVVQTYTLEGTRAAAELLFASSDFKASFEVWSPEPDGFAVSFSPAGPSVGALSAFPAAAYAAAERAHAELPEGGTLRMNIRGDELTLSARYLPDTSFADMQEVRAILEPISGLGRDTELFNQVIVTPIPKDPAGS
ncbi:hypothetical protein SD72_03675 [Leucobacter komagatae]|uniref:Uncharacterized protein n=1 Tax=Leucobacter komagatae TaxID=55969 RepID=A0A0D0IP59_9MICO|nr:hypothetical protein SD72_03675 [Leucobacter komagatae]